MWSKKEIEILKENYEKKSANMISKHMDRTKNAIYLKAQNLGLESKVCGSGKIWTDEEVKILKEKYPTKKTSKLAAELGRSELSIECNIQHDNIWFCKSSMKDFFDNINPVIKKKNEKQHPRR